MRYSAGLLLMLWLAGGCTPALKNSWTDFNAFYNTYYNAQVSYKRGITLIDNQTVNYNPERPIRIHLKPARAGQSDFEKAIDKGANILRNHPTSKWADDALVLIGKSYFYLGQYYSADQKFQETLGASPNNLVRQEAVLWRGRFFLEAERYQEGIVYLNARLISEEFEWNDQTKAEIELILAQMHVAIGQYAQASALLQPAIPVIRNRDLAGRAQFLHGQVLERLGDLRAAYDTYAAFPSSYRHYQLIYLANVSKGRIARRLGDYDLAFRTFQGMLRDDKNFEQFADLNYEVGRTLQLSSKYTEAETIYKNVLYSSLRPPSRPTIVRTHAALGEMYRDYYRDFRTAAAYFDSSARQSNIPELLPENFNVAELARSFGNYDRLRTEIQRLDSLMWLGGLPKPAFDSVLAVVRANRLREVEEQLREQQRGGTLVVVGNENQQTTGQSQDSGFLNYRNPSLVQQASQSFAAIWQERPLIDNWRRAEAVRQMASAQQQNNVARNGAQTGQRNQVEEMLRIDLSQIPFTRVARTEAANKIASLRYELGNELFFSMEMPDSAAVYYNSVVNTYPQSGVAPQAQYAMVELYMSAGDTTTALREARTLLSYYPGTPHAARINERYAISPETAAEKRYISKQDSLKSVFETLERMGEDEALRAAAFYHFGTGNRTSEYAPQALLSSALIWAQMGRESTTYLEQMKNRALALNDHRMRSETLDTLREQARLKMEEPALSEDEIRYWEQVADSTLPEPDLSAYYPFTGAHWDSVRSVLHVLLENHPGAPFTARARILNDEIKKPEVKETPASAGNGADTLFECSALDGPLIVRNGLESFINASGIMEKLDAIQILAANFELEITVDTHGKVLTAAPVSPDDEFGLNRFITEQARALLEFIPPTVNNKPVMVSCDFVFSVNR